MTPNIPPAIKDIIRSALTWDPRQRPSASKIVTMFENIYFEELEIVTEGFMDITSQQLMDGNTWSETNYPPKKQREQVPQ